MRILQISDFQSPNAGSFVPMLGALTRAIHERGWEMEAVLPERARARPWVSQLDAARLPVTFMSEHLFRDILRIARRRRGDGSLVLHTHFSTCDVAAAVAAVGDTRTRVIWHVHTTPSDRVGARIRTNVKYRTFGRCVAAALCVSPEIADRVRRSGARRALVLPNAIDLAQHPSLTHEERQRARDSLCIPAAAPMILHHGRDWHIKGGDLFVRALAAVREAGVPAVGVTLRGGAQARDLATTLGIGDALIINDGAADLRASYAAADVFAATSRDEGMPFMVLEALALGLPVVATDIPGHAAIAERSGAVALAPLEPGALATTLISVLRRDPLTAERESEAARVWVANEASVESWATSVADLYTEVAR